MSFRDDKDALLARADALSQELDTSKDNADKLEKERDDLRERAEAAERAAKVARKKLRKAGLDPDAKPSKRPIVFAISGVMVAGAIVGAVNLQSAKRDTERAKPRSPSTSTVPSAPQPAEAPPKSPASDKVLAITLHYQSIDHAIFLLSQWYPTVRERGGMRFFERPSWLRASAWDSSIEGLGRLATEEPAIPALDDATAAYAAHLRTFGPVLDRAIRYYQHEDYRDDQHKLGDELAPVLQKGFAETEKHSRALHPLLRSELKTRLEPVGEDGDYSILLDAAWSTCSQILHELRAENDVAQLLRECTNASDALSDFVRQNKIAKQEYVAGLFDKMLAEGKRAHRTSKSRTRLSAMHHMAQLQSYAAQRYAKARTAGP